jgi:succinate-semialdehyde dehydrogenase/glutarate-semialdehyde dehydrogenase
MTIVTDAIRTINPATGETIHDHAPHSHEQVERILNAGREAFLAWRALGFGGRAEIIGRVAAHLRKHKSSFAEIATREMGKPIVEAEAEIEKCAWACEYFAEHAAAFLADELVETSAAKSYVAFRPIGTVLAIMPWNFPYWQVFRFAAPGLMAGNVAVLKHAGIVTGCSLEIERIFEVCGAPEGVFGTLLVPGSAMDRIVGDHRIAAVTLTGSEGAGSAVASVAGKMIKKTVLELGGSDAFIVLADADLDLAAATAVKARFQNDGQSCIAAKRFIVEDAVYDDFLARFVAKTEELVVGDPMDRAIQLGPLAREDLREAIARQVDESVARGAKLVLGGKRVDRPGFFYEPTIVGDVTDAMPLFREETFGPAAAVIRARDAEHAIGLANDSSFGLGGNLWTRDIPRAEKLAERLECGNVFINGMTASDPRLPFGGVKRSGYGRELSAYGIKEFVNVQTVWIGPAKVDQPQSKAAE